MVVVFEGGAAVSFANASGVRDRNAVLFQELPQLDVSADPLSYIPSIRDTLSVPSVSNWRSAYYGCGSQLTLL
jgi:hypothetical protein